MSKNGYRHLGILSNALDGASSNTRLFAIRFCNTFGIDKPVEMEQAILADRLGLSLHITREAIRHLKRHEHLTAEPCQQRLGRPIFRYRLRPCFGYVRGGLPSVTHHHTELIEELLAPGQHPALIASEKILLAILLRFADRIGVVDRLALPKLSALTGCSEDRLRHLFRQLIKKGYLRQPWPGGTCRYLLGQCRAFFIVRLDSESWASKNPALIATILLPDEFFPTRVPRGLAGTVYAYARTPEHPLPDRHNDRNRERSKDLDKVAALLKCSPMTAEKVLPFFRDHPKSWYMLRYRLELIGEQLARKALQKNARPESFEAETRARITSELLPNPLLSHKSEPDFPTEEQVKLIVDVLYGLALDTAIGIYSTLDQQTINGTPINQCDFSMIPTDSEIDPVQLWIFKKDSKSHN